MSSVISVDLVSRVSIVTVGVLIQSCVGAMMLLSTVVYPSLV